jgi:hypothetical protein
MVGIVCTGDLSLVGAAVISCRLAAVALVALSGCAASIYYPERIDPVPGFGSACTDPVDATVIVENTTGHAVEVDELLPQADCPPALRGTVEAGETADLGVAVGAIWQVFDVETRELVGDFVLADGANDLVIQ